jgi:hypothetical protein
MRFVPSNLFDGTKIKEPRFSKKKSRLLKRQHVNRRGFGAGTSTRQHKFTVLFQFQILLQLTFPSL